MTKREKIKAGMRDHYFKAEAKARPGFADTLERQANRVVEYAAAIEGQHITYAELNDFHADGSIVAGLTAIGRGPSPADLSRYHAHMGRFFEAMAAEFPADALRTTTVGEVVTNERALEIWAETADKAA